MQTDSSAQVSFFHTLSLILQSCQTQNFATKECLWAASNMFATDALVESNLNNPVFDKAASQLVTNACSHLDNFSDEIKKQVLLSF